VNRERVGALLRTTATHAANDAVIPPNVGFDNFLDIVTRTV